MANPIAEVQRVVGGRFSGARLLTRGGVVVQQTCDGLADIAADVTFSLRGTGAVWPTVGDLGRFIATTMRTTTSS